MKYEIQRNHVDYWEEITEAETWNLIIKECDARVTPTLFRLCMGEEVCFEAFTLREVKK